MYIPFKKIQNLQHDIMYTSKKKRESLKKKPHLTNLDQYFFQIEVMKILFISVFILFLVKGTIANACMESTQEVEKGSAES